VPGLTIGRYRHYKGNLYDVIDVALHSETEEPLVIYRAADGDQLWARPLSMFTEDVTSDDAVVPRFKLIADL
jgi:hypothetical protein